MEKLSPEQTKNFRAAQKKRAGVIVALILIWVAAIFGLTLVKGHMAASQRDTAQSQDESER